MSCQLFYFILYSRDTCRTTNQKDFAQFRSGQSCICQCSSYRFCCQFYQIMCQFIEFCFCQVHIEVFRTFCCSCDEWQVDVGCCRRRKFFFRFLCRFFDSLQSHLILRQVYTFCSLELCQHVICYFLVEVITTQTVVTCGRQNFDNTITDLDDRYIKCTTT